MKKRLVFCLILVFLSAYAFCSGSLLYSSIASATDAELEAMAKAYGLDGEEDRQSLIDRLLDILEVPDEDRFDYRTSDTEASYNGTPGADDGLPSSASDVSIDYAQQMSTAGNSVILTGGVGVSFSQDDGTVWTLRASKVVFDLERHILEAAGDISLSNSSDEEQSFNGSVISMNWDSLDIVVHDGFGSSERKNAQGDSIDFFIDGRTISYAGGQNTIIFSDGVISTSEKDPYWSITARELAMMDSDMFVKNATFMMGRVPILWLPAFFYPGTRIVFNPALGFSSEKGLFFNSTYEVYGKYPYIGTTSTSKTDEDADATASILALLDEDSDSSEMVKDGFVYRPMTSSDELSELEKWALSSSSYLAVFGDVYQNNGLVMGYDTKNNLFSNALAVSSTGLVAYKPVDDRYGNTRFYFNAEVSFKKGKSSLSLKMPVLSDPNVKMDFLNRNTVFAFDSLFGAEQDFPETYKNSTDSYTWSLNASTSASLGNYSFKINTLKASVDYKLKYDSELKKYVPQMSKASLAELSLSSDGTFVNLKGKKGEEKTRKVYTDDLARQFDEEKASLDSVDISSSAAKTDIDGIKSYKAPSVNVTTTTSSSAGYFKAGYSFRQNLDNKYESEFVHDEFFTSINSSIYAKAATRDGWFGLDETVKPEFSFKNNEETETKASIVNNLVATSAPLGLTYTLSMRLYSFEEKTRNGSSSSEERFAGWDKTDVLAHSIEIKKKLGDFTFSVKQTLLPVTESLVPSASYSRSGFTASTSTKLVRASEDFSRLFYLDMKADSLKLDLSYSRTGFKASMKNTYTLSKTGWEGYSMTESLSATVSGYSLTFSQNGSFTGCFGVDKMSFSAAWQKTLEKTAFDTSTTLSVVGESLDLEKLQLSLNAKVLPVYWWKSRLGFETQASTSFTYNFLNPYATYINAKLSFSFSVAEFLDLKFSVSSSNKSFYRYFGSDGLDFQKLLRDLAASFDFVGNGRKTTGFNLDSFSLEAVHYMRDWNLYIKANSNIALSSGRYVWKPEVTVYVKWIAIPELKTEKKWEKEGGVWK